MLAAPSLPRKREVTTPGQTNLWRLDDLDWRTRIGRTVATALTRDECSSYMGDAADYVNRCVA